MADVEHLDDVRVIERLRDAPLVDEHLHHARHLDVARLDLLDDEVAGEARAVRQPQVGHAARREVADELVVAVALACDEGLRHRSPRSVCTTRTDERGERVEIVAAFEHDGDARAEGEHVARQGLVGVVVELEAAERIVDVGVEAGRDEDDVGGEGGDGRADARTVGGEIGVGARAARQAAR